MRTNSEVASCVPNLTQVSLIIWSMWLYCWNEGSVNLQCWCSLPATYSKGLQWKWWLLSHSGRCWPADEQGSRAGARTQCESETQEGCVEVQQPQCLRKVTPRELLRSIFPAIHCIALRTKDNSKGASILTEFGVLHSISECPISAPGLTSHSSLLLKLSP